ncbi:DUF4192 domain-containing protein [Nocardia sp. CDC153]|uniref:DUF4192 domain-containing protein n=1 Tax=Nocardia sp. CDC153 TaxID=3112167 RepID=UPI002DB92982|nr:DUF4192 domain-containing protein [Nocardia sp. CDC153]MEC3953997.1 DUF4192 domain-containing protein [Nocardia sp. CDC153]
MTAHIDSAAPDPIDATPPSTCLRAPGDLIAAIPAMLGFMPARSLVVALLTADPGRPGGAAVEMVTRMDLDNPGRCATRILVDQVAGLCVRHRAVAALAVIVDDRATVPTRKHSGQRAGKHRDLIAALEHRLDAEAVPLAGAWAVREIGPDLPWWTVTGVWSRGPQPDPATSMVTLRHVLEGRPLRASRQELTEELAFDPILREATVPAIPVAVAAAVQRLARVVRHGSPQVHLRVEVCRVLRYLERVESGARLTAAEVAEVGVALRDKALRDIMFALAPGPRADGAEALWLQLVRALPDPDRAAAAALLAYCAYTRGDGPLAGVALEVALAADPDHRMAQLLESGLRLGVPPARLSSLAESGREMAAELGIHLGPEPR